MTSVHTIPIDNTLDTHTTFKARLPWGLCKDVPDVESCDVILAFCPVTSRVGTDIEAALRDIPEDKPLALVVLHHTLDSNYTVPDTKRFIKRPDAIAVDCLFSDDGLMKCPRNDKAVQAVTKFLQHHTKRNSLPLLPLLGLLLLFLCCGVSYLQYTAHTSDVTTRAHTNGIHTSQHRCLWGLPQCQPRFSGPAIKAELELKIQQSNQQLREEISALREECTSFQRATQQGDQQLRALQEEVQQLRKLVKQYQDSTQRSIFNPSSWWSSSCTETQPDKELQSEPSQPTNHVKQTNNETAQQPKTEVSNDPADLNETNERMNDNGKQSDEQEAPIPTMEDPLNHLDNTTLSTDVHHHNSDDGGS